MEGKTFVFRTADAGGSGKITRANVTLTTQEGYWSVDNLQVSNPISSVKGLIDFTTNDMHPGTLGVSYSIAGVSHKNDKMIVAPNAHYLEGYQVATSTQIRGFKSKVYNDMQTTAAGVHVMRQRAGIPIGAPFFVLTDGTGIGGKYAFLVDGKLVILDSEVGHIIISSSPFDPRCGDLAIGHAEGIASGPAIDRMVTTYLLLAGKKLPEGKNPGAYLGECYSAGEKWAIELYNIIADAFARLLTNIRCTYDFKYFVYKGSAGTDMFNRGLGELVRKKLRHTLVNPKWATKANLEFVETPGRNNVDALVGAAYLLAVNLGIIR
jgi:predicted NBD/HSP70 family sugar kinase